MPVDGKKGRDGEYFVFSVSDNDFITQDGKSRFFAIVSPSTLLAGYFCRLFFGFTMDVRLIVLCVHRLP